MDLQHHLRLQIRISYHPPKEGQKTSQEMTKEVEDLHRKRAITPAHGNQEGYVSLVFLVPKSDESWRPVINLKPLNRYIVTHHFKMELVRSVRGLIQQGDWMVKLDKKTRIYQSPFIAVTNASSDSHGRAIPGSSECFHLA